MSGCATCRHASKAKLGALLLESAWVSKRELTAAELEGGICTLAATPAVVTREDGCPLHENKTSRWVHLGALVLCPWAEVIRLRKESRKALDRFAAVRDDALVARSALRSGLVALVELFDETGTGLRGTLSTDDDGNPIGRLQSEEWFAGWDKRAARTRHKVALLLKRLSHLRERSESVRTAFVAVDAEHLSAISSIR